MFSQKSVRRFVGDSSAFVMGAMFLASALNRAISPGISTIFKYFRGEMPLFRALAKNMAPMTNADESPTNRLTLFPIYLSLFIVSTLWCGAPEPKTLQALFRCHQVDVRMCSHRCQDVFTSLAPDWTLDDNKSAASCQQT